MGANFVELHNSSDFKNATQRQENCSHWRDTNVNPEQIYGAGASHSILVGTVSWLCHEITNSVFKASYIYILSQVIQRTSIPLTA